jgi:hypothetical protein
MPLRAGHFVWQCAMSDDEGAAPLDTQPDADDFDDVDAITEKAEDAPRKRVGVASTLPVVFPAAQKKRTTLLVQVESEKFDLDGMFLCFDL